MGVVLSGDGSQGKMQEELSPQSQSDLAVGSQEAFGPSLVEILGSLLVSGRLTMFPSSKLPQERLRSLGWMDWEDRGLAATATSPQETHPHSLFTTVHLKLEAPLRWLRAPWTALAHPF